MEKTMNKAEQIKKEILIKVKEYYEIAHKKDHSEGVPERIPYGGRIFDEDEIVNLVDSSLEFWLTYGRYSKEFESSLAEYLGSEYCFLVNSGSSANLLAFMALTSDILGERKIMRGDEVITVAAGFPTTVTPIIQYGAIPVFVDIDVNTLNINVKELKDALSNKTKAVMLAHTLGNPFDVKAVKEFCDDNGLWLIEDNCDALGSKYDGKRTGTFGDIGTSSFYPAHHITMGEGGAIYTDNAVLKKIILSLRDWGRDCWCQSGSDNTCKNRFSGQFGTLPFGSDHKYVYSHFGYNLKITDMQAAIGCAQLKKLDGFVQSRVSNRNKLYEKIKDLEEYFIFQEPEKEAESSWFGFMLTIRKDVNLDRINIVRYLEDNGIQTRNLFGGNLVRQPCFQNLTEGIDYRVVNELKVTDFVMEKGFWLGVYPGINDSCIDYISGKLHSAVKEKLK